MVKQIDLFMPPHSDFGVTKHFTRQLHEAFLREGIKSRILVPERTNPKPFFDALEKSPPDCTLSFNGVLPDEKGNFLCDMLKIPHVACLVDSPNYYIPLTKSPLNIITCPDRFFCSFFHNLEFKNALFMPHGVEKDIAPDVDFADRQYDVTFLGNCSDYEAQKRGWKEKYPDQLIFSIELAAEIALSNLNITLYDALVQAMNERLWFPGVDVEALNFVQILDDLEYYIRGLDRIKLVQNVKDAQVHIFSTQEAKKIWAKLLGKDQKNIVYHDPVQFEDAIEVMKNSKIILNSTPHVKNGAHERIFAGLTCGALVLTNESIYLQDEGFKDGENILFYKCSHYENINDKINQYLKNNKKRQTSAKSGREKVLQHHTWDNRAQTLLKELKPLLKPLHESIK